MDKAITVAELKEYVAPLFRELLTAAELATVHFDVENLLSEGHVLGNEELLTDDYVRLVWQVMGETGRSGNLRLSQGRASYLTFIRGDIQDFISTSNFAWGQLRGAVPAQ